MPQGKEQAGQPQGNLDEFLAGYGLGSSGYWRAVHGPFKEVALVETSDCVSIELGDGGKELPDKLLRTAEELLASRTSFAIHFYKENRE